MSVNKVILVGRLGQNPDMRTFPDGTPVATINLATSKKYNNETYTEWHRVVFFKRLAEVVGEYLKKGSLVYIEGELKNKKYTDKKGIEHKITEIHANSMTMLSSKNEQSSQQQQQQQQQTTSPPPNKHTQDPQWLDTQPTAEDLNNDLPF